MMKTENQCPICGHVLEIIRDIGICDPCTYGPKIFTRHDHRWRPAYLEEVIEALHTERRAREEAEKERDHFKICFETHRNWHTYYNEKTKELRDQLTAERAPAALDRERLGQLVRQVWIEWAREQPNPKPHWLTPWEELDESSREVDRRIGERVASAALAALNGEG